jgi:hypothetical protein
MLLKFGSFKFFDGADLTWNLEARLVCPSNLVGTVDVYQVDHHGLNLSNNPLLVRSLSPTVSVMGNGWRKGAHAETLATLRSVPSLQTMWQLHRNTLGGKEVNTDPEYIANLPAKCDGQLHQMFRGSFRQVLHHFHSRHRRFQNLRHRIGPALLTNTPAQNPDEIAPPDDCPDSAARERRPGRQGFLL